jgi:hypothetical protein
MESREFKRMVDELTNIISEENYVSYLQEVLNFLKRYANYSEEKAGEVKDDEKREIINVEKKELKELYNLVKIYLAEHDLRLGKNSLKEGEEIRGNLYVGVVKKKIPKFRGGDHKIYGPFKSGDIILISEKDFNKLRDRGLIFEREMEK